MFNPYDLLKESKILVFHLANLFAGTEKKVGTVPACSRRIFSPTNVNQSRCRILVFASHRANEVAKWKIGLRHFAGLNRNVFANGQ